MQDRLTEIKAREAAATPGPWGASRDDYFGNDLIVWADKPLSEKDIQFVTKSRADIPWLIEQVERLQAENERMTALAVYGPEL